MNALLYLPRSARPFLRFVIGRCQDDAHDLDGLFRARASESIKSCGLDNCYAWFKQHIKVPPRQAFEPHGGACWFRSDAGEAVAQMWELATHLRGSGCQVRFIGSDRPGTIIYYDEHQIVTRREKRGRRRAWHWEIRLGRPAG